MRYWWEYWKETICMTIIYFCMAAAVVTFAVMVWILGNAVIGGVEVVKNSIGVVLYAGSGVAIIWGMVSMIRA